jgi:hypothetical protein
MTAKENGIDRSMPAFSYDDIVILRNSAYAVRRVCDSGLLVCFGSPAPVLEIR